MGAVERYCDRALLLDRGEIVAIGDPHDIGQEYLRLNFADEALDVGGDDGDAPAQPAYSRLPALVRER